MPRIYVEFARMKNLPRKYKTISGKVDDVRSDFKRTISKLDWDVKYMSDINNTASQLSRKLDRYVQSLKSYQSFLEYAYNSYVKLDSETIAKSESWLNSVGNWFNDVGMTVGVGVGNVTRVVGETATSWKDATTAWLADVGNGISAAWGTTCEFIKENWQELGMTAVGFVQIAGGIAMVVGAFAAAPAGGVSLAAVAPGVAMIASGANTAIENIWDIADGDSGKGKDFDDLTAWVGGGIGKMFGNENAGEKIGSYTGTVAEIVTGAYGGYGLGKAASAAKHAGNAQSVMEAARLIEPVGSVAFDGLGGISEGDYVGGAASILFGILGADEYGKGLPLVGRPTAKINFTNQDMGHIFSNIYKGIWSESASSADDILRSVFAY